MTSGDGRPVALVTGAASGIGAAVIETFLGDGYRIVGLDAVALEVDSEYVLGVVGDVTSPQDNRAALTAALDTWGRLDVFVGNAGVHDAGVGVSDVSPEALATLLRRVLEVDVVGYTLGAATVHEEIRRRRGSMLFTLSDASFDVSRNGAGLAYATAKHAGVGLVRHLAATLGPQVRVNGVAPGGIETGLQAVTADGGRARVFGDPATRTHIAANNPLGAVLVPAEVAPLYLFLASPAARGITGEVVRSDCGFGLM